MRREYRNLLSKETATQAASVGNANACLGSDRPAGNKFLFKVKDLKLC